MASVEEFFDLKIATVDPGEAPPPGAHLARIVPPAAPADPGGWFDIPSKIRYVAPVPHSLDGHLRSTFGSDRARKLRAMIRKAEARYRFVADPDLGRFKDFKDLYLRSVVGRSRGVDRIGDRDRLGDSWTGLYFLDGDAISAGILLQRVGRHLSVSYGAFDPVPSRKLDLEHVLILRALERSIELGFEELSLGVDTNRYGHHLSLGLPAYKWRIGFRAVAYPPGGREWIQPLRFDVFERGLFFYAFAEQGLTGHLFTARPPDERAWRHACAPRVVLHPVS